MFFISILSTQKVACLILHYREGSYRVLVSAVAVARDHKKTSSLVELLTEVKVDYE